MKVPPSPGSFKEIRKVGDLFAAEDPRPFDADPGTRGHGDCSESSDVDTSSRETFAARVAAYFKARPGEWIDGRDILEIAGCYGWRTRISDCRRAPYNLRIVNRQRGQGRYVVSEYQLGPVDQSIDRGAA